MSSRRRPLHAFPLACLILSLAACGPFKEFTPTDRQALNRQVESLVAAGDAMAAARVYLDEAAEAEGVQAIDLRLDAGKVLLEAGFTERALEVIGPAAMSAGSPHQRATARIMLARYFEDRGDLDKALRLLGDPIPDGADDDRLRILQLQAQYQLTLGSPDQSILARTRALALLSPEQQQTEVRDIWRSVQHGSEALTTALAADPRTRLWADMAALVRVFALDPASLQEGVVNWTRQYAQHPATPSLASYIQERFVVESLMPSRISVLLPLTGRLAEAGMALRDGMLTAYYRLPPADRPTLDFHDTATTPANHLYAQVLGEETGAIIGPLRKEDLHLIATGGEPPVPVLALNRNPAIIDPPANFFQFGLSPEDEAAAAARRLIRENHRRSLSFIPEGDWGDRVAREFAERYEQLGGTVLANTRFDPRRKDFSDAIQSGLGLDHSKDRSRELAGLLGMRPVFEPRRRQDIQAIFLAAPSWQARLIKPQLTFHRADAVPVYATSRVYSGYPDAEADQDLNGLRFADAPWVIGEGAMAAERSRMEIDLPGHNPRYVRFYALGYDALNLLPRLQAMKLASGQRVSGATGHLYSDPQGVLHRDLIWARFHHGTPRLAALPPENVPNLAGTSLTPGSPARP